MTLQPSKANGLEKPSQVMVDKVMTLPLDKLSNRIGAVSAGELDQISASLRVWMDL
jgi:mRNA interferase MazF